MVSSGPDYRRIRGENDGKSISTPRLVSGTMIGHRLEKVVRKIENPSPFDHSRVLSPNGLSEGWIRCCHLGLPRSTRARTTRFYNNGRVYDRRCGLSSCSSPVSNPNTPATIEMGLEFFLTDSRDDHPSRITSGEWPKTHRPKGSRDPPTSEEA